MTKTTQVLNVEITIIDEILDENKIKKLLNADDVHIKRNKIFEHSERKSKNG